MFEIPFVWKKIKPFTAANAKSEDFDRRTLPVNLFAARTAMQITQREAGEAVGAAQTSIGHMENHPYVIKRSYVLEERAKNLKKFYDATLARRCNANPFFVIEYKVLVAIFKLAKYGQLGPDDIPRIGAEGDVYDAAALLIFVEDYLSKKNVDWNQYMYSNWYWRQSAIISCTDLFHMASKFTDPRTWNAQHVYTIDAMNDILDAVVKNNTVKIPHDLDTLVDLIRANERHSSELLYPWLRENCP